MINFIKTKKITVKARDYRVGTTVYNYSTNSWSVALIGIGTIPITIEDCSIKGIKKLYSTPHNDVYEEWTETTASGNYNLMSVNPYWSKFKPGMKLKGNIINNKFVLR